MLPPEGPPDPSTLPSAAPGSRCCPATSPHPEGAPLAGVPFPHPGHAGRTRACRPIRGPPTLWRLANTRGALRWIGEPLRPGSPGRRRRTSPTSAPQARRRTRTSPRSASRSIPSWSPRESRGEHRRRIRCPVGGRASSSPAGIRTTRTRRVSPAQRSEPTELIIPRTEKVPCPVTGSMVPVPQAWPEMPSNRPVPLSARIGKSFPFATNV